MAKRKHLKNQKQAGASCPTGAGLRENAHGQQPRLLREKGAAPTVVVGTGSETNPAYPKNTQILGRREQTRRSRRGPRFSTGIELEIGARLFRLCLAHLSLPKTRDARTEPTRAFPYPWLPYPVPTLPHPEPTRTDTTSHKTSDLTLPYHWAHLDEGTGLGVKVERDGGNRPPWSARSSLPRHTPTAPLHPPLPLPHPGGGVDAKVESDRPASPAFYPLPSPDRAPTPEPTVSYRTLPYPTPTRPLRSPRQGR